MEKTKKINKFIWLLPALLLYMLICLSSCCFFLERAYGMETRAKTYIVVPKNNKGELQSLAIKRAIKIALKKSVEKLTGIKNNLNKKKDDLLKKHVYIYYLKYIYSFKIIKAKRFLNLYYIDLIVHIRKNILIKKLRELGFKVVLHGPKTKKNNYDVYYIKFIGNFSYSDSNKFQKLMLTYSKHLYNLYVSSFSKDFVDIKILYYSSIIRLFKRVKVVIGKYLDAKISPVKNNTIIINVKRKK